MKFKSLKRALLLGAAVGAGTYAYKKYEELKVFYNEVVIGNSKTLYYSSDFEDDSVAVVGSSVNLNFLGIEPESPSVYFNIFSTASSVKILVPDDCRVILDGKNTGSSITVIEGEVEDFEKKFTLYIDYKATASAIKIVYENALYEEYDDVEECDCGCCCDQDMK